MCNTEPLPRSDAPPNSNLVVGQHFLAVNHGGEVHTFTEVEEFGGCT